MPRRKDNATVPTVTNQAQLDAQYLAGILNRYGQGECTFNVHYSLKRPADAPAGPIRIMVGTPSGPRAVVPTILTVIGAHFGVTDFAEVPSASGRSTVWTSKATVDRIGSAGFMLTKWSKLRRKGDGTRETVSRPATVVDASAF